MEGYNYVNDDPVLHIVSRSKAMEMGFKRYFSGVPCKRGHISDRNTSQGLCLDCNRLRWSSKEYRESKKKWDDENREHLRNYHKEYRKSYGDFKAIRDKRYVKNNQEKVNRNKREYYKKNRGRIREWGFEYREKYRDAINEQKRDKLKGIHKPLSEYTGIEPKTVEYNKPDEKSIEELLEESRSKYIKHKIRSRMSGMVRRMLSVAGIEKEVDTISALNYSPCDLRDRIESLFLEGMSWEESESFHIDHLYPISRFIDEGITSPKIINALSNLAPMYPEDNISKSNKTLQEWLEEKGKGSREWELYSRLLNM